LADGLGDFPKLCLYKLTEYEVIASYGDPPFDSCLLNIAKGIQQFPSILDDGLVTDPQEEQHNNSIIREQVHNSDSWQPYHG